MDEEILIDTGTKENPEPVSIVETEDSTEVTVGKKAEQTRDSSSDRLAAAEAEQARLRAQLSDMQVRSAPQLREPIDPYKSQEENIKAQERALGIEYETLKATGSLTKQIIDDFDTKARNLQQERINIGTQRAIASAMPALLNAQQAQAFRNQYHDVNANPRALQFARGVYDQALALGEQDGPQLVDKAMNEARIKFGMTPSMKPTNQDRAQLSGVSGTGGKSTSSNTVKMGKSEKQMALAMYKDVYNGDEKKCYAAWAKGPGMRAKKAAEKMKRFS